MHVFHLLHVVSFSCTPILHRLPSLGLVHHVLKHLHDTSTCQVQDDTSRGITSVLYPWQHTGMRHTYVIAVVGRRHSVLFLAHIDSSAYYSLPRHSCSCRPQHQVCEQFPLSPMQRQEKGGFWLIISWMDLQRFLHLHEVSFLRSCDQDPLLEQEAANRSPVATNIRTNITHIVLCTLRSTLYWQPSDLTELGPRKKHKTNFWKVLELVVIKKTWTTRANGIP